MKYFSAPALALFSPLFSSDALACPLCHTTTAEQVRAGIEATAQSGAVIGAMIGPFLAMGIIVGILHRTSSSEDAPADTEPLGRKKEPIYDPEY